jgi:hypothetical protein
VAPTHPSAFGPASVLWLTPLYEASTLQEVENNEHLAKDKSGLMKGLLSDAQGLTSRRPGSSNQDRSLCRRPWVGLSWLRLMLKGA